MTTTTPLKCVVLVNGIPASGKSTLTRALSQRFGWPVLTLDSLKEPFMACFAPVDRQRNRQLGCAAYQAIWNIVGQAPASQIWLIDAWFGFQSRAVLEQGLQQAGVDAVLELWMQIAPEAAVARYQARLSQRLPGHPGAEYLPELRQLAQQAEPMALGPVLRVNASAQDERAVAGWLQQQLERNSYTSPQCPTSEELQHVITPLSANR
ncbi:AAA family ATPase [Pantoea brenneri]|uniref:AAA family ATPase n=1 Tax=Pantoea brenneri TaxID=472694 RepID=UPI002898A608|nr:AAA family ATPase [Pantoea brenneri]